MEDKGRPRRQEETIGEIKKTRRDHGDKGRPRKLVEIRADKERKGRPLETRGDQRKRGYQGDKGIPRRYGETWETR